MKCSVHSFGIGIFIVGWFFCMVSVYQTTHTKERHALKSDVVDIVVFSFDRPMQLYAFLESTYRYLDGLGEVTVIYRSSDNHYKEAYDQVQTTFPEVTFVAQGSAPKQDFKPLLMNVLDHVQSAYIAFAVDDIIVKKEANLSECIRLLEKTEAHGFYLRLGMHINYCYAWACPLQCPPLTFITDNVAMWKIKEGKRYWGYPSTVDMTIYRTDYIIRTFGSLVFTNPNTLESSWDRISGPLKKQNGLCFDESIVVNIPLNIVQDTCKNRYMHEWDKESLLKKFQEGFKIDIQPLYGIKNNSAHYEFPLSFIPRIEAK